MTFKYSPINPKYPHMLHGADYNPDQWIGTPEILDDDFRLMKLAGCNVMSIGIFSWATLEPEEGKFDFSLFDNIMNRLADNNMVAVFATPSGAKPAWLSQKYPEILRMNKNRVRNLHGERHNHCFTSPVYRQKSQALNTMLAERYKDHPALLVWHVSNEYGGECHCPLCQEAFRDFLKVRYNNDLDKLNREWWTGFWSHRFTDWSQIESPSPRGENSIHGLSLDWNRFVVHQTIDFYKNEAKPLREITPNVPITTNFIGLADDMDQFKIAKELDVASWDSYPFWHNNRQEMWETAVATAFSHNLYRSLKGGKPFMLMESTPSAVNWTVMNKLKKPGFHLLSAMQAVAHGADTVQYFQWRKGRGGFEKFHGAVVDHVGHENTRVFSEVSEVGEKLKLLDAVVGTKVKSDVAMVFDWENRWAIKEAKTLCHDNIKYEETCFCHYQTFWKNGIPVDIVDEDCDFSGYKLLIAPMMYMVREGVGAKIEQFVKNGGTLVTTYWSGIVSESDLCYLGGFPGPLLNVTGIWAEEIDPLYENEKYSLQFSQGDGHKMSGKFEVKDFYEHIHAQTAQVLATFEDGSFQGMPALTVNAFGSGNAYYIAARTETAFLETFYSQIIEKLSLKKALETVLPQGVSAQVRTDGETDFIFVMNFNEEAKTVNVGGVFKDLLSGEEQGPDINLPRYGVKVLARKI